MTTTGAESPKWLPGILGIGSLLLLFGTVIAYVAFQHWPAGAPRNSAMATGLLLAVGAAGLLALKRWGWAMTTAGCIIAASLCGIAYARSHESLWFIWSAASAVFFLYLVRASVRERMR